MMPPPLRIAPAPSLWRNLAVAALVPLALLLVAFWLGLQNAAATRSTDALEQSLRRQIVLERMFSTMKDAETGQRGYVLTGQPAFLRPYEVAHARLPVEQDALLALKGSEGPDIGAEIAEIDRLIALKFTEMERIMTIRREQGLTAASQGVTAGQGKALMDAIRAQMARIDAKEKQALAAQEMRARDTARDARRAYGIGVLILTLGAFAIAYVVWSNRRARHRALVQMIDASARQQAMFDNALNAIILINPSGSIEILNPAAERLFGYPATDLLRRDISIIVDVAPGDGPFLDRLGLGADGLAEPFRPAVIARRRDGSEVPVEVALGTMPLDDGMHVVAVLRDISEREKVERMKDQFLSTVSHELRTPLTSIVGALGLLRAGAAEQLPAPAQRLVVIAENNANRLIRIVNDILDAEKLQSGAMRFDFHPIDLNMTMGQALDGMRGLADSRSVLLQIADRSTPLMVRADAERLQQVVANLLSNAIKFSPEGGTVLLALEDDGQTAHVSVIDSGSGIAPDMRDRLFTRFAQGAQGASDMPGTGLGLTIAKEIVHNHGGRIWHEDAPTGGSIFRFTLPVWNALTGQEDLNGAPRLLVYAEPDEAQAIAKGFASRAIRADAVDSAQAAMEAATTRAYVALILDFALAGEEAVPLVQAIRADPALRTLPVIAIAAEEPPIYAAGIASLDIIDWIRKPISPLRLDEAIGSAVERTAVTMPLVLHVDDDSDTLEITARALSGVARMARAADLASARAFLAEHRVDIAIVDMALPDGSGLEIVEHLNRTGGPGTPIIIYSAQDSDADLARDVEAVLTKSRRSLPNLVDVVMRILDRRNREGAEESTI